MFKEEIMKNGEFLLAKLSILLNASDDVEIFIKKDLFDEKLRRIDKEYTYGLYRELTFYQGRWCEISMLLEDYKSEYYRVRKFFKTDTLYVIPRTPKHTVVMKKVA